MRNKVSIIFALLLVLGFGTVAFAERGLAANRGGVGRPSMGSKLDRRHRRRHHRRRRARRHMGGHSAAPKNMNSH